MRRITLAGTRYLLVEFPRLVSADAVTNALSRVQEAGLTSVLAHPERYSCCSVENVAFWRGLGARMQVDATTLHSPQARGQRARQLVAAGLADILAGDNHGDERTIAGGADFLRAQDGTEQAELLTVQNPAAILRDEPLAECRRSRFAAPGCSASANCSAAKCERGPRRGRTRPPGGAGGRLEGARAAGGADRGALRRGAAGRRHAVLLRQRRQRGRRAAPGHRVRGALRRHRRPLAAVALTTDTSLLTAAGNDLGFEQIFARQVEALCRPGDLLVLHSTSGRSPNLVAAARAARTLGTPTVAFLGRDGGTLMGEVDEALVVPADDTGQIQLLHLALEHLVVELVESALLGAG